MMGQDTSRVLPTCIRRTRRLIMLADHCGQKGAVGVANKRWDVATGVL